MHTQDTQYAYYNEDGSMAPLPMQIAVRRLGLDLMRAPVSNANEAIELMMSAKAWGGGLFVYLFKSGTRTAHWARYVSLQTDVVWCVNVSGV
jgi:hypothetical protein